MAIGNLPTDLALKTHTNKLRTFGDEVFGKIIKNNRCGIEKLELYTSPVPSIRNLARQTVTIPKH